MWSPPCSAWPGTSCFPRWARKPRPTCGSARSPHRPGAAWCSRHPRCHPSGPVWPLTRCGSTRPRISSAGRMRTPRQLFSVQRSAFSVQLEEEIILLSLSDGADSVLEERLAAVAAAMVQEPRRATDIARWLMLALPRLPERARRSPAAWALSVRAGEQLGLPSRFVSRPRSTSAGGAPLPRYDGLADPPPACTCSVTASGSARRTVRGIMRSPSRRRTQRCLDRSHMRGHQTTLRAWISAQLQ